MPELTYPLLLAAPQLLPGAEFSPALGILLAGEVGALGKGQRETPVPVPRVAGRGVGGRPLTSLLMLSAMALCQAAMICSESCWMRNSEPSRVFSCGSSGQRSGQGHGAARGWPRPRGFGDLLVAENGAQLITPMTPVVAISRRAGAAGNLLPVQSPRGKTPPGARMTLGDISMPVGKGQGQHSVSLCSQPWDVPYRPHRHQPQHIPFTAGGMNRAGAGIATALWATCGH